MAIVGKIIKGKYFDSVSLMRVSQKINNREGVEDSSVVMGSLENRSILKSADLFIPDFEKSSDNDLLVVIKGDLAVVNNLIKNVDDFFYELKKENKNGHSNKRKPTDIGSAKDKLLGANLALISVAGKFAAEEAEKALNLNLNVMLFSDNITIEDEIRLKQMAFDKNLLVMGPDCGTAIINGVPLAFANVVRRGDIGIIAASGTGLQEVSSLISNHGGGISQAIGTGGRDIKKEVGGPTFIQAIRLLGVDTKTKKIVLISKPPDIEVISKIKDEIKKIGLPTYALFLGINPTEDQKNSFLDAGIQLAEDLTDVSFLALGKKREDDFGIDEKVLKEVKEKIRNKKYIRALFSGGTFATETQIIWSKSEKIIKEGLFSNVPIGKGRKISDIHKSFQHTVIDMGDDDFTVGRPHPMIDFSTRLRRIEQDSSDQETAIILVDIVLGYGAHLDPMNEVSAVFEKIREKVVIVASVTGTEEDPQVRSKVVDGLKKCGVLVFPSNSSASRFCSMAINANSEKGQI